MIANAFISLVTYWKDVVGASIIGAIMFLMFGPILFARHLTVRKHREQFKATGGQEFPLPSARHFEAEEPAEVARPSEPAETLRFPMDEATATIAARAQEIHARTLMDTETGELTRLGPDGLPLSEADLSARTPSTAFTVDPERLDAILNMERTGEYPLNRATFIEMDAAEQFMRDPLGSALLPPEPLIAGAGNPALAAAFYSLLNQGGLRHDWDPADSDFDFWGREMALEPAA